MVLSRRNIIGFSVLTRVRLEWVKKQMRSAKVEIRIVIIHKKFDLEGGKVLGK